jgi:phosphatidate cytidylyltransferase
MVDGRKSDLGIRTLSAIVMLAVAGGALWLGGWFWVGFVAMLAVLLAREWKELVRKIAASRPALYGWLLAGVAYISLGAGTLIFLRGGEFSQVLLTLLAMVIGTDIGAYFLGRMIGGPKIAPSISPSKTWAGLLGGMIGAALLGLLMWSVYVYRTMGPFHDMALPGDFWAVFRHYALRFMIAGVIVAPIAQAGDFFESWLKRRAGVKDSGTLIPGHGGVFDRADGLLAVAAVVGIYLLVTAAA